MELGDAEQEEPKQSMCRTTIPLKEKTLENANQFTGTERRQGVD